MRRFAAAEIDSVYLLYNEFKSVLTQRVTLKKVLPLSGRAGPGAAGLHLRAAAGGAFESSAAALCGVAVWRRSWNIRPPNMPGARDGRGHQQRQRCDEQVTLYTKRVRQASVARGTIRGVVSGAAGGAE